MPSIPSASTLESRGLSHGATAGVSVGAIVGSILIVICLWPFVARYVRRQRRKRHAHSEPAAGADLSPAPAFAPPVAQVKDEPGKRRMSRDSHGLGPDGRPLRRQSTRDLTLGHLSAADDLTPQPPLFASAALSGSPTSESPTGAPPQIDTDLAQPVASCERRGYSDSYYDTDIPTEAFGAIPWEDKRTPRSRQTRSSSKLSAALESILRRATTSQKSTSAPSSTQHGENISPWPLSESPTELEPPSNALSRSSSSSSRSSSEEGGRALDLGEIEFPSASPPPAPPIQPGPGTVNPMEVMGAMTAKEQTWRTNAELMNLAASPASHSTSSGHSPDAVMNGDLTAGMPSQSPEGFTSQPPTPSPYPAADYGNDGDQLNGQTTVPEKQIPEVFVKDEATYPSTNLDSVPPLSGQVPNYQRHQYTNSTDIYYTDNSTYSTPFPAPSPSGFSTLNTPDTRVSDSTASPLPLTPEARQGVSPNSGLSPSPQTPQILVCDRCGQKFDQQHKLKYVQPEKQGRCMRSICANSRHSHHRRYHERPHVCERPGCGKRFGTKTHLDRHVNDKHEQTRRYHCPEQTCAYSRQGGKSFPRKDNLRRHMVNKHNQSPQPDQEFDFVDVVMSGS